MKRGQIGKFRIKIQDIADNLEAIAELTKGMVILGATLEFQYLAIEYVAVFSKFKEIAEDKWMASEYPYYQVVKDGGAFYLMDDNENIL